MSVIPKVQKIRSSSDVEVGDFLKETIPTSVLVYTIVYQVVEKTKNSITVVRCREGRVLLLENRKGNRYMKTWNEAVPDEYGRPTQIYQKKGGGFSLEDGRDFHFASRQDGVPATYTDRLF